MNKRTLGKGTKSVGCVGYGGMHLSLTGRPDERTGIGVIHAALDHGIDFIDTANVYCLDNSELGHNERLIAKALDEWSGDRSTVTVATKAGMTRPAGRWERDGRPQSIKAACEASLEALGTERIELYQLHAPDPTVPYGDSVGVLKELQEEGKVRWVGLSNVDVAQIDIARDIVEVKTVQNRLNPFFREALEDGVVSYCTANDIAFIAYSPVGGGRLNKKLPDHPVVNSVAEKHGTTPHCVVLAWVLEQSPSVIIIPSARSRENVINSASVSEVRLTEEDLDAIDRAEFSRA